MIGAFGEINFLVSDDKIRTFDELTRTVSGRWVDHEILGKKPMTQYIGANLDEISFVMEFNAFYGLDVEYETDRIVKMVREGKAYPLTIGNKGLGMNKWTLRSAEIAYTTIDARGRMLIAGVNVTLKEYVK